VQTEGPKAGEIYLQISKLPENSTRLKRNFSSVSGDVMVNVLELD